MRVIASNPLMRTGVKHNADDTKHEKGVAFYRDLLGFDVDGVTFKIGVPDGPGLRRAEESRPPTRRRSRASIDLQSTPDPRRHWLQVRG